MHLLRHRRSRRCQRSAESPHPRSLNVPTPGPRRRSGSDARRMGRGAAASLTVYRAVARMSPVLNAHTGRRCGRFDCRRPAGGGRPRRSPATPTGIARPSARDARGERRAGARAECGAGPAGAVREYPEAPVSPMTAIWADRDPAVVFCVDPSRDPGTRNGQPSERMWTPAPHRQSSWWGAPGASAGQSLAGWPLTHALGRRGGEHYVDPVVGRIVGAAGEGDGEPE